MRVALSVEAIVIGCLIASSASAQTWTGPTPYLSAMNSPFFATQTVQRQYFLEDLEDATVDTRGLVIPDGVIYAPSVVTDSVDIDDQLLNGLGTGGYSMGPGALNITLQFDNTQLGGYPTRVGFVWTDGPPGSTIQVVAMNPQDITVAQIFSNLGDASFGGTTADDRFIGIEWPAGIAQLQIQSLSPQTEIDHIQYNAPTLQPLYVRDRANNDAMSDLIWHKTSNNKVYQWLMNGLSMTQMIVPTTVPAGWIAQGCGDLDADGDTDIVWRDPATNLFHVWLMSGATVSTNSPVQNSTAVASNFVVIAVADFDGDRKADILFRNTSNSDIILWKMNGNARVAGQVVGNAAGATYLGCGDVNGDGRYDVIWRQNSSNLIFGWLMNGFTPITSNFIGNGQAMSTDWVLGAMGDLDGDGRADLIWRNTVTSQVKAWLLESLYRKGYGNIGSKSLAWTMRGCADINGDGKADLLWTNASSGQVNAWLMNSITLMQGGVVGQLGNSSYWTLINR
ncbi:MAG: VCBS repeat-containing protein [Phycisphaerales bacterium]